MKTRFHILTSTLVAIALTASATDELPKTLMTIPGKILLNEDFTKPHAPFTGKPVGFASGFSGWRYNLSPKGGKWELMNGTFKGTELAESHHPATASYGIPFKDAIIQCEVRLEDVPEAGRLYRSIFLKATDAKDYVCSLSVGPGGLFLTPYDDTRINPATKQREKGPTSRVAQSIKPGEWHTVVLEIKGDEVVGSLDGKCATLSNPLIAADKHSIMLGVSIEASFRNLRMWEALPNPDWSKNKQSLATTDAPAGR